MRIYDVEEEPDEDVFAKVFSVAEKAGVTITAKFFGTCHRLQVRDKGPKLLIAKLVGLGSTNWWNKKKTLRKTSIYENDDLTLLPATIASDLRSKNDVRGVVTENGKIIVIMQGYQKLVFNKLQMLQNLDTELFSNAYKR